MQPVPTTPNSTYFKVNIYKKFISKSPFTNIMKPIVQTPSMYECNINGKGAEDRDEILAEYKQKRDILHKGLYNLIKEVKPRFIELQNNMDDSVHQVYGVDGGPAAQLIMYDKHGSVIVEYKIGQDGWYHWTGSDFKVRVFPSSQGKVLTDRIAGLMTELKFKKIGTDGTSRFRELL
jgi:hypothetical protein